MMNDERKRTTKYPKRPAFPERLRWMSPTRCSVSIARAEKIWCRDKTAVVRLSKDRWWTNAYSRYAYPFVSGQRRHRSWDDVVVGLCAVGLISTEVRDAYLAAVKFDRDVTERNNHVRYLSKEAANSGFRLVPIKRRGKRR